MLKEAAKAPSYRSLSSSPPYTLSTYSIVYILVEYFYYCINTFTKESEDLALTSKLQLGQIDEMPIDYYLMMEGELNLTSIMSHHRFTKKCDTVPAWPVRQKISHFLRCRNM